MKDKWRVALEFLGLLLVSGAPIFVALQISQDRKIALAQLHSSQLKIFVSRLTSGLGSDAYLPMNYKLYVTKTWNREGFSDKEVSSEQGEVHRQAGRVSRAR